MLVSLERLNLLGEVKCRKIPGSSVPSCPHRPSPPGLPSSSFEGMAQRVRLTQQRRAQGFNEKNHSTPEMTGILREWILYLSLLRKFPNEALIFLSPVLKRSNSKEEKKEDIVPKFLAKFPLLLL